MIKNKNLRLYEALAHEIAMDAAAKRELTDEQRQLSRDLLAQTHARLAQIESTYRQSAPRKVRPEVAAMARPGLLEWLGQLLAPRPRSVFAFRDLERMSDDDLRNALEDALTLSERMS
jgi:hypothetical protein